VTTSPFPLDPEMLAGLSDEEITALVSGLPPSAIESLLKSTSTSSRLPPGPAEQGQALDPGYRLRPHTAYLSSRLAQAVADMAEGRSRRLIIETPPRVGKSTLVSVYLPLWVMRQYPTTKTALVSYDPTLTTAWARSIRNEIEDNDALGINLARDGGAAGTWMTAEGGELRARSTGKALTGTGANLLVIDDPVKDFADAHSPLRRQALWDWWLSVAQTRLEPPSLVVVTLTRWHEDDLVGRLLSREWEGDPADWEEIRLPALAEENDPLDREVGEPLYSPLLSETEEEAIERWGETRTAVGSYTWASMFQQRPAPAKGAIFDTEWWRFWTTDPSRVTDDGRVVLLDPEADLSTARWLDSWDAAFKATDSSDYVVGQRWARLGSRRYLIHQVRGRWSFTQTIERMRLLVSTGPGHRFTHQRLVEEKANGAAIIDTLKDEVSGIKPVNPVIGKEGRARAITPEIESGHVYLPHPSDEGNEWVQDLLSEVRNFPHDSHDDVVDALTQALSELRDAGTGAVTVPRGSAPRSVITAAHSTARGPRISSAARRPRGPGGR